ncbi:MAG: BsuPI-related putative proteinase inhibitor [bacterium]
MRDGRDRTVQAFWLCILVGVMAATSAATPAPTSVERVEGGLRVQATVSGRAFAVGIPIPVVLAVRNTGSAAVAITFMNGQRYDLLARRPRGDEVWRWSHDRAFIQAVQTMRLGPGEEEAYRITWDQRDFQGRQVDPGSYELVAIFMGQVGARQGPLTLPPLSITISP